MALSSSSARKAAAQGPQVGVIRMPKGTDLFKIKAAGQIKMVIFPFTIGAGAKYPNSRDPQIPTPKAGQQAFVRDYYTHNNFGASGKEFAICPRLTHGLPCPICEAIKDQLSSGQITKDQAKAMNAKQRSLFNVWLPEENKVVLFDTSYNTFTKQMYSVVGATAAVAGMEYADYFADATEGSFIHATFIEKPLSGNKYYELVAAILQKHGGVPAYVLAKAVALDDVLVTESYEALKARFWDLDASEADSASDEVAEAVADVPVVVAQPPAPIVVNTQPPVAVTAPVTAPAAPKAQPPKQTKPKAEKPSVEPQAQAELVKGSTVYHNVFGKCEVLKVQGNVITILDEADEPHKVQPIELSKEPTPAAIQAASQVKADSAADQASASGDESWDDWSDEE